jgi:uncharacterized membrane protein
VETVWSALALMAVAIGIQFALPPRLTAGPRWVLPSLEAALVVGLLFATPRQLERPHPLRRRLAIGLTALVSAANIASLALLSRDLLKHASPNGRELIWAGALIWLTNILVFGLWYWEVDRGGPGVRAAGHDGPPDFLFPQMNDDAIQPASWRPDLFDYVYLSVTNATAFSPTDTMPLSHRAKSMMGLQALVSFVTVGLIFARAVNILQ